MRFIPIDRMKVLREAAKSGDSRAKKILIMQMNDEDFSGLVDEYFETPAIKPIEMSATKPGQPVIEPEPELESERVVDNSDITDERLREFLNLNGVQKGDEDYEDTLEAYYKEFPKARPQMQESEIEEDEEDIDVVLPDDNDDNTSIYGEEDEPIVEDEYENKCFLDSLIEDEYEAIQGYDKAISDILKLDNDDTTIKGLIASLEAIRRDEFEHVEKLKKMKETLNKK